MAGTLTISTLSDGTNSTSSTNCIQGSAKAWVNFNGTTSPGTIRASYNVGSVTKNGTGNYTINLTTPMSDTNYATAIGGSRTTFSDYGFQLQAYNTSTSQVQVQGQGAGSSQVDWTNICVAIFR